MQAEKSICPEGSLRVRADPALEPPWSYDSGGNLPASLRTRCEPNYDINNHLELLRYVETPFNNWKQVKFIVSVTLNYSDTLRQSVGSTDGSNSWFQSP